MSITRKRLLHSLVTVAMLVLLVIYGRDIQWRAAWNAIRHASVGILLVATAANFVTLFAKAIVWWIFLRAVGVRSLGLAVRATAAGAGLNNILIANSGEAARAFFVTRAAGVRSSAVLAALALERLFDFIGYVMVLAGAALLLPMPVDVRRWRGGAMAVLVAIFAMFAVLLARKPPRERASNGASLLARARAYGSRFMRSVHDIVTVPRLLAALLLTIVNWGAQLATYHLTAVAAHFPITLVGSVATLLTANVGFLVRATPGNVGVFQMVYAVTAQALGLDRNAAIAVALLLQTLQNVPVTLFGMLVAPEFILHWRDRRVRDDGAPDAHGSRRATDPAVASR